MAVVAAEEQAGSTGGVVSKQGRTLINIEHVNNLSPFQGCSSFNGKSCGGVEDALLEFSHIQEDEGDCYFFTEVFLI